MMNTFSKLLLVILTILSILIYFQNVSLQREIKNLKNGIICLIENKIKNLESKIDNLESEINVLEGKIDEIQLDIYEISR